MQMDAVVTSEPRDSQFPPAFWVLSTDVVFYDFVGARSQTTILNIGGDTVLIDTSAASQDRFQALLTRAKEVLATVEWEGES